MKSRRSGHCSRSASRSFRAPPDRGATCDYWWNLGKRRFLDAQPNHHYGSAVLSDDFARCITYHLNERRRNVSTRSNWPLIHGIPTSWRISTPVAFPLSLLSSRHSAATALLRPDALRFDVNSFTANDIIRLLYQFAYGPRTSSSLLDLQPACILALLLRANYPSSFF